MTYRNPHTWLKRSAAVIAVSTLLALVSTVSVSGAATPKVLPRTTGKAEVACAGSLLKLYEDTLGPAFHKATGDLWGGPTCQGSLTLASEILAYDITPYPGVFLAVGAHAIKELFPTKQAKFAMAVVSDPLVVAFSKKSADYKELNAIKIGKKPLSDLFSLFTSPGFKLGRTNPPDDPQGIFFILMAKLAEKVLHLKPGEADKALGITKTSPYGSKSQIFDEDSLPTDIATGVVDAGSEYLPEAKQYGLDYITLPKTLNFASPSESKLYGTVALKVSGSWQAGEVIHLNTTLVLPGAKGTAFKPADEAADQAFVAFLLKSKARSILKKVGYTLIPPVLVLAPGVTKAAALPPAILKLFNGLGGTIGS